MSARPIPVLASTPLSRPDPADQPATGVRLKEVLRSGGLALVRGWLRARSRRGPPEPGQGGTVVLAPHPDDAELGCGGLIASRRRRGLPVAIVYVTDGAASHPGHPSLTPPALAAMRRREARAAAAVLGVAPAALMFLNLPDGQVAHLAPAACTDLAARIAETLAVHAATQIFTPYRADHSSEHDALFPIVQAAVSRRSVPIRTFEYPVWSAWNPRLLAPAGMARHRIWRCDLDHDLRHAKRRAIAEHRSQTEPTPPWRQPQLPDSFLRCFDQRSEFYFET